MISQPHILIIATAISHVVPIYTLAGGVSRLVYPEDPVPMRLELGLDAERYFVGENFPAAIRIVNPNSFDVYLNGFEFGPLEPHTEISFPDAMVFPEEARELENQEFIDISLGGTISPMGGPPVLVPAHGHIEHRRLVYCGTNLEMGHWVLMVPGTYRMRMRATVGAVVPGKPMRYAKVAWSSDVIDFVLRSPDGHDRLALEYLRNEAEKLAEHQRNPEPGFRSDEFELARHRRFLERFSDTVYAPEIRWRTTKLLEHTLQNYPSGEGPSELVDLFDECLAFCLEKGGAFAEDFLGWNLDRGGNGCLNLAIAENRWRLVDQILQALDQRQTGDEAAKLFRRARVAGLRVSGEAARGILETIIERFPNDRYAEVAKGQIENIERGWWPPKPPDEEERLYRAAAREVSRSPEKGRQMLESVLQRYPNGRFSKQIRTLIDAIDDGTWPPKPPGAAQARTPEGPRSDEN